MKRGQAEDILGEATEAVEAWPNLATEAGVSEERIEKIRKTHRLDIAAD